MERKGILIKDNDMAVTLSEPAAAGDMVVYEKRVRNIVCR